MQTVSWEYAQISSAGDFMLSEHPGHEPLIEYKALQPTSYIDSLKNKQWMGNHSFFPKMTHLQAFPWAQQSLPHWASDVLQHIAIQRCNGHTTLMFDLPQNYYCFISSHIFLSWRVRYSKEIKISLHWHEKLFIFALGNVISSIWVWFMIHDRTAAIQLHDCILAYIHKSAAGLILNLRLQGLICFCGSIFSISIFQYGEYRWLDFQY